MTSAYYRGAMGAIVCFDLTDYDSLKSARTWMEEFRSKSNTTAPIVLVGNKIDLVNKDDS